MTLDVLDAMNGSIDRVLAEGRTFEQWKKDLVPELQRLGWWGRARMRDPKFDVEREVQLGSPRRLKTIFHMNTRTAYAAQLWETIQKGKRLFPYLKYVDMDDDKVRPLHAFWGRTIVLRVDDEWWLYYYPPNDWNCRCSVRQLSERDLARLKLEVTSPPPRVEYVSWVNRRTGQTEQVPRGLSPGFGYNVGAAWLKAREATKARAEPPAGDVERILSAVPLSALNAQLRRAEPEVANAALRALVASDTFAQFLAKPSGLGFPVMRLSEAVRAAISADDPVAALSAWTAAKQAREHPDLTIEDYRQLPELGAAPTVVIKDSEQSVVIVRRGERSYLAVVRRTSSGAATFVQSFRRVDSREVARQLRRGQVVFGKWE
jgi:hypothetical protein